MLDSYDVIILPDASYNSMLRGLAPGSHPAKYTGGMTQAGVDNLRTFVQNGGTLVTINGAAQLPIRALHLKAIPADDEVQALEGTPLAHSLSRLEMEYGRDWTPSLIPEVFPNLQSLELGCAWIESGARWMSSSVSGPRG